MNDGESMPIGTCSKCGREGKLELHHIAGRANDPVTVTELCTTCHKTLTSWQYANGTPLKASSSKSDGVKWWSYVTGVIHVGELICTGVANSLTGRSGRDEFKELAVLFKTMSTECRNMLTNLGVNDVPKARGNKRRKKVGPFWRGFRSSGDISSLAHFISGVIQDKYPNEVTLAKCFEEISNDPDSFLEWVKEREGEILGAASKSNHQISAAISMSDIISTDGLIDLLADVRKLLDTIIALYVDGVEE